MAHTFELHLSWSGDTATAPYSRDFTATAEGKTSLLLSSATAYAGDGSRWNPEDLFGASLGLCHALTFLSLTGKFGLVVQRIEQRVEVTLETVDRVSKITRVTLFPTLTLARGPAPDKVQEAWEKAHKYCFIANSITAEVVMPAPELVFT